MFRYIGLNRILAPWRRRERAAGDCPGPFMSSIAAHSCPPRPRRPHERLVGDPARCCRCPRRRASARRGPGRRQHEYLRPPRAAAVAPTAAAVVVLPTPPGPQRHDGLLRRRGGRFEPLLPHSRCRGWRGAVRLAVGAPLPRRARERSGRSVRRTVESREEERQVHHGRRRGRSPSPQTLEMAGTRAAEGDGQSSRLENGSGVLADSDRLTPRDDNFAQIR